jgi:glyceraldehyde 3-phosphate dehydrogenase
MLNIGINGFGRIGRSILRNVILFDDIKIVVINDINPEIENIAYLLKYDSYFGRFNGDIKVAYENLIINGSKIKIYHKHNLSDVPWEESNCDIIIEAVGKHGLLDQMQDILNKGIKKIIVTFSQSKNIDKHIVLGANENEYDPINHNVISGSICDSVALTPVYKIVNEELKVKNGFLTTLHPWLASPDK